MGRAFKRTCCRMCNCQSESFLCPCSVWLVDTEEPHLELVRWQGRAASPAAPRVLLLCSLSSLPVRQAAPQHPHLAWSYIPQLSHALTILNLLLWPPATWKPIWDQAPGQPPGPACFPGSLHSQAPLENKWHLTCNEMSAWHWGPVTNQ